MLDYETEAQTEAYEEQLDRINDNPAPYAESNTQLKMYMLDRKASNKLGRFLDLKELVIGNIGYNDQLSVMAMLNQLDSYIDLGEDWADNAQSQADEIRNWIALRTGSNGAFAKLLLTQSKEITRGVKDSLK